MSTVKCSLLKNHGDQHSNMLTCFNHLLTQNDYLTSFCFYASIAIPFGATFAEVSSFFANLSSDSFEFVQCLALNSQFLSGPKLIKHSS